MSGIYIRFADDGRSIERCSNERFDGANGYAFHFPDADAPIDPDPVEIGARAAARAMGFDFDEQCGYETEAENCDSNTCVGGLNEDHHPADCREMMRHIARAVLAAQEPTASRFFNDTVLGSLTYRKSWPRPATPCDLVPLWAGEFASYEDWCDKATTRLTGTYGQYGEAKSICVDALGRRCLCGGDFMRARDEGAYPVRYFFECVDPCIVGSGQAAGE